MERILLQGVLSASDADAKEIGMSGLEIRKRKGTPRKSAPKLEPVAPVAQVLPVPMSASGSATSRVIIATEE